MEKRYFSLGHIPCAEYINGEVRSLCIALHGFGGDKESSAIRMLAEAIEKSALICFDFPAHGASEAADSMLTVENCISDLKCVIEHSREKYPAVPICFFATSFGGYILLLALRRGIIDDAAKIVLRAPAVRMHETFLDVIAKMTAEELRAQGSVTVGFERKMDISYRFADELAGFDAIYPACERELLIIHGDCDDVVLPGHIREFCEAAPNVRLHVIEGADHRFKGSGQLEAAVLAAAEWFSA